MCVCNRRNDDEAAICHQQLDTAENRPDIARSARVCLLAAARLTSCVAHHHHVPGQLSV